MKLTEMQKYTGVRYATDDEIKVYQAVESLMKAMDDEAFEKALDIISDYTWAIDPAERKTAYAKAYRLAKHMGVTVPMLDTWYCMDAYD